MLQAISNRRSSRLFLSIYRKFFYLATFHRKYLIASKHLQDPPKPFAPIIIHDRVDRRIYSTVGMYIDTHDKIEKDLFSYL